MILERLIDYDKEFHTGKFGLCKLRCEDGGGDQEDWRGKGCQLERKLSKIKGVNEATVTFMTKKLTIDCDESIMDSVVEEANKIIHKLEPEVIIKER